MHRQRMSQRKKNAQNNDRKKNTQNNDSDTPRPRTRTRTRTRTSILTIVIGILIAKYLGSLVDDNRVREEQRLKNIGLESERVENDRYGPNAHLGPVKP
ncbi:MAG: hypothetical protein WCG75_00755 [Armatimonadota bacterium]